MNIFNSVETVCVAEQKCDVKTNRNQTGQSGYCKDSCCYLYYSKYRYSFVVSCDLSANWKMCSFSILCKWRSTPKKFVLRVKQISNEMRLTKSLQRHFTDFIPFSMIKCRTFSLLKMKQVLQTNALECVRSLKSLKGIDLHRIKVSIEKFESLNMQLLGHC